jgi:starch synthase
VIAVSEAMRRDVLRLFTVDPPRVVVIHNGVDPEQYQRTPDRTALERRDIQQPYVLFVGRISEQKGIFDLLQAARSVPDRLQVVLCATSPDTPELEARLRLAVEDHPRVRWIREMVPVPEVVQLYSHAVALVCPSVYEPFGVINLEAMACGTPVIASAVGGILEVVEDKETGLLVPPGRPDDLARAIVSLLDDPARARAMGMAGRRRVEARFTWARVAERTEQVYAGAIEDYRSGQR